MALNLSKLTAPSIRKLLEQHEDLVEYLENKALELISLETGKDCVDSVTYVGRDKNDLSFEYWDDESDKEATIPLSKLMPSSEDIKRGWV